MFANYHLYLSYIYTWTITLRPRNQHSQNHSLQHQVFYSFCSPFIKSICWYHNGCIFLIHSRNERPTSKAFLHTNYPSISLVPIAAQNNMLLFSQAILRFTHVNSICENQSRRSSWLTQTGRRQEPHRSRWPFGSAQTLSLSEGDVLYRQLSPQTHRYGLLAQSSASGQN